MSRRDCPQLAWHGNYHGIALDDGDSDVEVKIGAPNKRAPHRLSDATIESWVLGALFLNISTIFNDDRLDLNVFVNN